MSENATIGLPISFEDLKMHLEEIIFLRGIDIKNADLIVTEFKWNGDTGMIYAEVEFLGHDD